MQISGHRSLLIVVFTAIFYCATAGAATERIVDYEYDDAGNIVRIITREQSDPPVVGPLAPEFINQGQSRTITTTGSNLLGVEVSTSYPGLSIEAVTSDETQISFQLTASSQTPVGSAIIGFTTGLGEVQQAIFVAEKPPALAANPNPIAIAHNNSVSTISLEFSVPRPEDETYTLSTGDPSVADTVASSFTILAGQSQVDITLTGLVIGSTNLNIELAAKFYAYSFPVFVGKSYEELAVEFPDMLQRNLFAASVGVLLQDGTQFEPGTVSQVVGVEVGKLSGFTLDPVGVSYGDGLVGRLMTGPVGVNISDNVNLAFSPRVGAIYGPLIDSIQPTVVAVNPTVETTVDLDVSGVNLDDVLDITLAPDTNITVDGFTVNTEGTQLTLTLTIDPLAALGERVVSLQDSSGVVSTRTGDPLTIDLQ